MIKPDLSYIHKDLRHLAVPIADLNPDTVNARKHSEKNIAAIRGSLKQFGQRRPAVVQRDGMIVRAGNGMMRAAIELGWTHLAIVPCDEDNVSAIAFAITDNRTAELAEWDSAMLDDLMREVAVGEADLQQMMDDLAQELNLVPGDEPEVTLKPVDTKAPPKMSWVLIGIPTVRFGEISETIEAIAVMPGVICESTVNDG